MRRKGIINLLYNVSYELNYTLANNINFTDLEGLVWSSSEDSARGYAKAIDLCTGTYYMDQEVRFPPCASDPEILNG
jgi:hypothetical protein